MSSLTFYSALSKLSLFDNWVYWFIFSTALTGNMYQFYKTGSEYPASSFWTRPLRCLIASSFGSVRPAAPICCYHPSLQKENLRFVCGVFFFFLFLLVQHLYSVLSLCSVMLHFFSPAQWVKTSTACTRYSKLQWFLLKQETSDLLAYQKKRPSYKLNAVSLLFRAGIVGPFCIL